MWTDKEKLDLLHEVMIKVGELHEYNEKAALGEDLYNRVCHALGWDIDWDKIREVR